MDGPVGGRAESRAEVDKDQALKGPVSPIRKSGLYPKSIAASQSVVRWGQYELTCI